VNANVSESNHGVFSAWEFSLCQANFNLLAAVVNLLLGLLLRDRGDRELKRTTSSCGTFETAVHAEFTHMGVPYA